MLQFQSQITISLGCSLAIKEPFFAHLCVRSCKQQIKLAESSVLASREKPLECSILTKFCFPPIKWLKALLFSIGSPSTQRQVASRMHPPMYCTLISDSLHPAAIKRRETASTLGHGTWDDLAVLTNPRLSQDVPVTLVRESQVPDMIEWASGSPANREAGEGASPGRQSKDPFQFYSRGGKWNFRVCGLELRALWLEI